MRALLVAVALMGCGGSVGTSPQPDGAAVDAPPADATILTASCPNQGVGDGWTTGLGTCPTFDGYICADALQQSVRPGCCDGAGAWHACSSTPTNWHLPYVDAGM